MIEREISARIEAQEIIAEISTGNAFSCVIADNEIIAGEIGSGSGRQYPDYEGDYTIVPDKDKIILPSRNTVLHDDIVITAIPAYRVGNRYGTTFTIGG